MASKKTGMNSVYIFCCQR